MLTSEVKQLKYKFRMSLPVATKDVHLERFPFVIWMKTVGNFLPDGTAQDLSAILSNGKTIYSGGTSNGTALPNGKFLSKRNDFSMMRQMVH